MTEPALSPFLPNYTNPPVVETILGVQFDRLLRFGNAHLGAFWKTLDTDAWPIVSDAPLLASQSEDFSDGGRWGKQLGLQLTNNPACRLQIKNSKKDRLIQVQNNGLYFNWIKVGEETYPRYETVRDGFCATLASLQAFIEREKIGKLRPNQWEVTYINHIPKGSTWRTPQDWTFFEPLGAIPNIDGVIQGESFGGEWHFLIPEQKGRLHIQWQHGVKEPDKTAEREFVRLTFTARGPVAEHASTDAQSTVCEGLDLGRETIVNSFRELMSEDANKFWGLQNAGN